MKKFKKGDIVLVTGGKDKGKKGEIIRILPKLDLLVVKGVNMYKRAVKPTQNKPGGMIALERPMSPAKVMLLSGDKPVRVGLKRNKDSVARINKKTGKSL